MPSHKLTLSVSTDRRTQLVEITAQVAAFVAKSSVASGLCHIYSPHTTAGIVINENADPDVARDLESIFDRLVPRDAGYAHAEGNSDSHAKSILAGASQAVPIENARLALGKWQGIFFAEFDGPRRRQVHVTILS